MLAICHFLHTFVHLRLMKKLEDVISHFDVRGRVAGVEPLGSGLINDTYLVATAGGGYVLQRINHAIFRDVELLQSNISRITDHIRTRLKARGETDIERKALRLVPARDGKLFHFDGTDYWRMTVFIAGSRSFDHLTAELAEATGRAFGDFQRMLADMPEELGETIPDFHNMEFRLEQFREAIAADKAGRVGAMQKTIDELLARADEMCRPQREGRLPRRVAHCDTKIANVLFDEASGEVLCVIDLDTTMPGFVMSDFGDFIRTAGNTGAEDDRDLSRVGLNVEIFKAFARGYLAAAGGFLTDAEVELLPFGARLLTYMQAVRFLTDYLNGDTYYKVSHPEQNRDRAIAQLAHLVSLEAHEAMMNEYIKSLIR